MKPKIAIGVIVAIIALHYALLGYYGEGPSYGTELLHNFVLAIAFAWWALDDAKARHFHRPYEFGAFILFAWFLALPVYLVATRGWKGLPLSLIFVSLYLFPWIVGASVYYL